MKILLIAFILSFALFLQSLAQGDTLLINLKSSQIERISLSLVQKKQFENITSVEEYGRTPFNLLSRGELKLKGNNPNPFHEYTSIEFEIASPGNVEIIIYNNSGEYVQTLKCENCQAGNNILRWNCLDTNNFRVQNGIYYYEVRFNIEIQSRKMLFVN